MIIFLAKAFPIINQNLKDSCLGSRKQSLKLVVIITHATTCDGYVFHLFLSVSQSCFFLLTQLLLNRCTGFCKNFLGILDTMFKCASHQKVPKMI